MHFLQLSYLKLNLNIHSTDFQLQKGLICQKVKQPNINSSLINVLFLKRKYKRHVFKNHLKIISFRKELLHKKEIWF
jgi:hypothetical protein